MSQHHQRISGRKRQERNRKILAASDVCYICGRPGADAVDHVVPISRGGSDDPSNLKPAHHDIAPHCNRRKADLMPSEVDRRVVLVCGPPGAGKTTFARALRDSDGLELFDLDDERWQGSDPLFRAALVQVREDPSARAVVIRTGATMQARQRAATTCGATECVVIDTDLATCVRRIKDRARPTPPLRVQIGAARKWWDDYEPGEIRLSFASLQLQRSGSLR